MRFADATDDVVTVSGLVLSGAFTVAAWVKLGAAGGFAHVIGDSTSFKGLRFPNLAPSICDAAQDIASPTNFVVGDWHHVVGILDGTNGTIFVDGIQKNQVASAVTGLGSIFIGARTSAGAASLNSNIDSVRAYNRVLNRTEVHDLFLDEATGHPQTLNWFDSTTRVAAAAGGATAFQGIIGGGVGSGSLIC